MLTVDPERLLEFRWGAHSVLRCELIPDGNGCRLRVLGDPRGRLLTGARNAAGWEQCLGNLERLLRGAAPAKFAVDVWRARFDHYVATFEPRFGPQQGMPETHPEANAEGVGSGDA